MHCHGYDYACTVSQTCIVRSLYAIRSSWYCWLLWCWCVVGDRAGDADHESEVAALDLKAIEFHHTSLDVGHVGMLLNGFLYEFGLYTLGLCTLILMLWLHSW